jgi:hypothetical protein
MIYNWSPSRLFAYEECPRRTKYESVDKMCPTCFQGKMVWVDGSPVCDTCNRGPEEAPALVRGTLIHAAAEEYIAGRRQDIDVDLQAIAEWLNLLRQEYQARRVRVEMMLALTKDWKICDWKSKQAWLRLKIDVAWFFEPRQVAVVDWKSGKVKKNGEYTDQLNIYNVGMVSAGLADAAQSKLIFTDHGIEVERPEATVHGENLEMFQKSWTRRANVMLTDTLFPAKAGGHCRWCAFSCNKGGPCDY